MTRILVALVLAALTSLVLLAVALSSVTHEHYHEGRAMHAMRDSVMTTAEDHVRAIADMLDRLEAYALEDM